jgi:hypothetical protein
MTQTINNVKDVGTIIAKTAAGMLGDKLQFLKTVDKEPTSSFGQYNGFNAGDTINISKPARFIPTSTVDLTSALHEVVEEKTSLALDIRQNLGIALTSAEIQHTLGLKDWMKRALDPMVASIAHNVEATCLTRAKNGVTNFAGTAGSTTFDTDTMLSAREKLVKSLVPDQSNLYALLDSSAIRSAVNSRKGYVNPSDKLGKQYVNGQMFEADGFTFLENNLLPRHTNGGDVAFSVEATVVTIANGMSTLGVDGVTGGATIKAGTKFTLPAVYKVHPITKATLPELQVFTVLSDVTETAGNSVTLSIAPAIYYSTTDPRRNVDSAPVDEDACTVVTGSASTAYTHNLAYHKSAFRFVSVPLMKPEGAHMVAQETVDGITMRVWQDADILTDKMILRLDFLGGFSVVRPEWGCVISS